MAKKRATPKTSTADKQLNKGSRPLTYDPDIHQKIAKALCAKGTTVAELAAAFSVAISMFRQGEISHPAFFESCKVGFEPATDRVSAACSSAPLVTPARASRGAEKSVYAPYQEHVPPDPRACKFWLSNRSPDRWKHKQTIEHDEGANSLMGMLPRISPAWRSDRCPSQRSSSTPASNPSRSGQSSPPRQGADQSGKSPPIAPQWPWQVGCERKKRARPSPTGPMPSKGSNARDHTRCGISDCR